MACDRDQGAVLIDDADVGDRLALLPFDLGNRIGQRDGVANEDRRQEAHAVVGRVAERLGERAALDALIRESLKELAR